MAEARIDALTRLLACRPVTDLIELAAAHQGRVALVGGAIRDALLGRDPADLDVIVEGDLEGFLDAVAARRGRPAASIGDRFQGTRRMRWAGIQVDVARSLGTLEEDLARRDFTVNAMAVELPPAGPAGTILDPNGGMRDFVAGILRQTTPGVLDADPLRALRAVRYATALEGFDLEPSTRESVRAVAPRLVDVAAERCVAEWLEILELDDWAAGLDLARELAVADPTLGALTSTRAARAWAAGERDAGPPPVACRLAALLLDLSAAAALDEVVERLAHRRWPRRPLSRARRAAAWSVAGGVDEDTLAARALEDADAAATAAILARRLAEADGREPAEWVRTLSRFAVRAREPRWVRGDDLLAAGHRPGERLGALLRETAVGQVQRRWPDRPAALQWALARSMEDAP